MTQKRLKSLKRRSLRKTLKVSISKRQQSKRLRSRRQQSKRKQSKRQQSKRKQSKRKQSKRKQSKRFSSKRPRGLTSRFAVIPDDILEFSKKYPDKLDEKLDLFLKFNLLKNGVDDKKIKQSFKVLALEFHPDKNEANIDLATSIFQKLNNYSDEFIRMPIEKRQDEKNRLDTMQAKEKNRLDTMQAKEKYKQMSDEERKEIFRQKRKTNKEVAMENIKSMTPQQKDEEMSKIRKRLESNRQRQEEYYFKSFLSSNNRTIYEHLKRIEQELLDELNMYRYVVDGFEVI
jgi:hypothetical protein